MKKLTAIFLTILILITTLTACSGEIQDSSSVLSESDTHVNNSNISAESDRTQITQTNKEWLLDSKYLTDNLEERKANLLALADHSKYNKTIITIIPKTESSIENDGDIYSVSDGYLYGITEDGQHVYFKDYGKNFVFYGKYSFYSDMYSFDGYDSGDRLFIYYNGDIPKDGDISNMDLITFIPEYSLVNSKTTDIKLGEEQIKQTQNELYSYLYEYDDISYNIMSLEEAILAVLQELNSNPKEFYKKLLSQGGYYYTNDVISILGYAKIIKPNSVDGDIPQVFVAYNIFVFNGEPNINAQETYHKLFFNTGAI